MHEKGNAPYLWPGWMSWPAPGRYICDVQRGQRKVPRRRVTGFAGDGASWRSEDAWSETYFSSIIIL